MNPLIEAVRSIVLAAAVSHGVDPRLMERIAACESGYNRYAMNSPYVGLYQLGTNKQRQFLAEGYTDLYDPAQQANFVAELIAQGELSDWAGCLR
ncbi:MAG TPA: transglycosylase SLT domain-containing protein [Chloroflexota bacterium]|nr:transglycosylase SLT domain-containing protein [Chloroflexota bacterium]